MANRISFRAAMEGLPFPFSKAFMVRRETPDISAMSFCESPSSRRRLMMLSAMLFILGVSLLFSV